MFVQLVTVVVVNLALQDDDDRFVTSALRGLGGGRLCLADTESIVAHSSARIAIRVTMSVRFYFMAAEKGKDFAL